MGPESDGSHIFEAQNDTFLMKKALQKPLFEKNWPLNLLDQKICTLGIILSHKHERIHHIWWIFRVIFTKNGVKR